MVAGVVCGLLRNARILGRCLCLQTNIPETSLEVAGTLQDYLPVFVELELVFGVDCSAIGVA